MELSSSWSYKDTFVAAGSGGLFDPQGIAFDPDGNLYVSSGANQILHYDNIGAFKGVFAAGGGLNTPQGLTFGPDKHLYVVDLINSSVLQFDGSSGDYLGPFTSGEILNIPTGLIFGPDGDLYVTSTGNNAVLSLPVTPASFARDGEAVIWMRPPAWPLVPISSSMWRTRAPISTTWDAMTRSQRSFNRLSQPAPAG